MLDVQDEVSYDFYVPRILNGENDHIITWKSSNEEVVKIGNISFASIDIILNLFSTEEILERLEDLKGRGDIRVMIHEQYFYKDYERYQADFEEKLKATFAFLVEHGYHSAFYEDLILE